MKIAISSQGNTLESQVDQRFGRARWFIVIDTDTDAFDVISNEEGMNAIHGAGIQAAENIARHDVNCVITGHCGPNAFRTLKAAGIKVITGAYGTISEILEKFKKCEFESIDQSDVKAHWFGQ